MATESTGPASNHGSAALGATRLRVHYLDAPSPALDLGFHYGAAGILLRRFGTEWLWKVDLASGAPRHGAARCRSDPRVRSPRLRLGSASVGSGSRCCDAVGVARLSHYREGGSWRWGVTPTWAPSNQKHPPTKRPYPRPCRCATSRTWRSDSSPRYPVVRSSEPG